MDKYWQRAVNKREFSNHLVEPFLQQMPKIQLRPAVGKFCNSVIPQKLWRDEMPPWQIGLSFALEND